MTTDICGHLKCIQATMPMSAHRFNYSLSPASVCNAMVTCKIKLLQKIISAFVDVRLK